MTGLGRSGPVRVGEADTSKLRRQGLWLEGISIAWTVLVAALAVAAGITASSIALIGLGLESAIEILAAMTVMWQLIGGAARASRATRLIAITFLAGGAYLVADSIRELAGHDHSGKPDTELAVAAAAAVPEVRKTVSARSILGLVKMPNLWLLLIVRLITDPVWYFYLFWYPKFLTESRHLTLVRIGRTAS